VQNAVKNILLQKVGHHLAGATGRCKKKSDPKKIYRIEDNQKRAVSLKFPAKGF
jgi:hypothetical protein